MPSAAFGMQPALQMYDLSCFCENTVRWRAIGAQVFASFSSTYNNKVSLSLCLLAAGTHARLEEGTANSVGQKVHPWHLKDQTQPPLGVEEAERSGVGVGLSLVYHTRKSTLQDLRT